MRYEIRYRRLGDCWAVIDTADGCEVWTYRTWLAAQRHANRLNDEAMLPRS